MYTSDGESYSAYRARRYFPALDGLRGIAVMLVMLQHVVDPPGRFGYAAVALFFAISGFLITTLLLRERAATGQISLARFHARRALRIFPVYYAMLAVYLTLVLLLERDSAAGRDFLRNFPWFATHTSNWVVDANTDTRIIFYFAWALATEQQFYLLWPPVLRLTRSRTALVGFMAVVAVGITAAAPFFSGAAVHAMVTASPVCIGCIAALVADHPRGFAVLHAITRPWWAFGVLFAAAALAGPLGVPTLVLGTIMTLLVVACSLPERIPLALPLARGPLPAIGLVSYGMYLMHMLVTNVVARTVPVPARSVAQYGAVAVLTIALATLSYNTYERWFLRLKERFRADAGTVRAPALAGAGTVAAAALAGAAGIAAGDAPALDDAAGDGAGEQVVVSGAGAAL